MENETLAIKKIGNRLLFAAIMLVGSFACAADPTVQLVLKDINGSTLEQAAAGVPFIVEVIMQGIEGSVDDVIIQSADKFSIARQGVTQQVRTVNGVTTSSMTYRFAVRIDSSGTYQLGPALVKQSGREYSSSPVRVQVGKKKAYKQQATAEVQLSIDKDLLFPGESTTFRIRFYADESVSLSRITPPEFGALKAGEMEGPFSGYDTAQGKNRYYLEWRTQIYAEEAGTYRIPAILVEYRAPRKGQTSLLDDDFFGGLFSRGAQVQQETSNSLEITINSLPQTDKQVAGVGVFSSVSLSIDRDTIPLGEGAVITLEIEGTENLERLSPPPLTLPEQLNYYDSKQYMHHASHGGQKKKICEYILQGKQEGTVTIPSQKITFFNLATRSYTTLATRPITVTITSPVVQQKTATVTIPDEPEQTVCVQTAGITAHELLDAPLYSAESGQMAWWLFFLLSAVPIVVVCLYLLFLIASRYATKHAGRIAYITAFMRARRELARSCKQQQYQQIYTIFKQLFIDRIGDAYVPEERMIALVRDGGASGEQLRAFETFIHQIAAISFGSNRPHNVRTLEKDARSWINFLRKYL